MNTTEQVIQFGQNNALMGILTLPAAEMHSVDTALIIVNSGLIHRVGQSRLSVRIARHLAGSGIATLRFDFSGIGDSLSAEHGSSPSDEIGAAIKAFQSICHAKRIILMGFCAGTIHAIRYANQQDSLSGMILINVDAPQTKRFLIRHHLLNNATWKQLFIKRTYLKRVAARLQKYIAPPQAPQKKADMASVPLKLIHVSDLEKAVEKNINTLLISSQYDTSLDYLFYSFKSSSILSRPDAPLHLEVIPGAHHFFYDHQHQQQVMQIIQRWLTTRPEPQDLSDRLKRLGFIKNLGYWNGTTIE